MTCCLFDPAISVVLDRLLAEAKQNDAEVMPLIRAERERLGDSPQSPRLAELLGHAHLAVSPAVGRFLYQLVRMKRPRTVVEFGTSHGISTIHLAAGLKDNGCGRLIATELQPEKIARARANVEAVGLANFVDVRPGDALETLRHDWDEGIDLLLLDGWKDLYLPLLRQLEPQLAREAVIVADDIDLMPEVLAPYLEYVRNPAHGFTSVALPLDDGLELSIRSA
jgi:predicted O-methyltransferase YrrM